jgi:tetratricopeptide (TPR) repeat protein
LKAVALGFLVTKVRNKFLSGGILLLSSLTSTAQVSHQNSNPSLLQDAAQAITVGKLSRAEGDLQSVLRAAPDDYRALDLLGVVRILQQREILAEKLFRHAVQKKPDFAPARAHLGLLYVQMGRPEEAVPELREAVRLDPARSDASGALVRILRDQARAASATGDSEKALALLMDARKYAPDNPDVNSELGTIALQLSLWQDAVEAFQGTLKIREDDTLAVYNLGRAFMGLSRFEDARQQFARYVGVRPDDASGHCALGMTLAALEQLAEARKEFERSIALAPAQTESYFRLGLIDLDAKDLDGAARNLHQVLAREAKHAGALSALGRVAFEQKRYPDAIDLLQQAIASDESLREAHYYLGLTFARVGRKAEAEAQLQIAIRLEHDEAERRRTLLRIQDGAVIDPHNSQPEM